MTRTTPTIRTRGHRPLEGVGLTVSCQDTIPTRKQDPLVKAYPGGGALGLASLPFLDYRSRGRKADPKKPRTDSPIPGAQADWGSRSQGVPSPPRSSRPGDRRSTALPVAGMSEPIRCRRPSRCKACGKDTRRGQPIKYRPADAQPGQPRTWIHDHCELGEG